VIDPTINAWIDTSRRLGPMLTGFCESVDETEYAALPAEDRAAQATAINSLKRQLAIAVATLNRAEKRMAP